MLSEIAGNDYGKDVEKHLPPLRRLRDMQVIPTDTWYPCEVLELGQYQEIDVSDARKTGVHVLQLFHIRRAFCCAGVIATEAAWDNANAASPIGMVRLIESLERSGISADSSAAQFAANALVARLARQDFEIAAYYAVCFLWFILKLDADASDEDAIALCDWTIACEIEACCQAPRVHADRGWLLRTSRSNQDDAGWRALGARIAAMPLETRSDEMKERVRLIGVSLSAP